MKLSFSWKNKIRYINTKEAIDISIGINFDEGQVNCFYAPYAEKTPVIAGDFIGSVKRGGSVNFYNININPHGNGTHTECYGHITQEGVNVSEILREPIFISQLLTIEPKKIEEDWIITEELLAGLGTVEGLIIRTLPNGVDKRTKNYSGTNPIYFHPQAIKRMVDNGVKHLLVDFPSIDKEEDGGLVKNHKLYWNEMPARNECTITELVFVPNELKDDYYLVNLQIPNIALDAVPSRPLLYVVYNEEQ